MILLAFLVAGAEPVPVAAEEPITVIGERLKSVTVSVSRDPSGRYACGLDQSTGNGWLDGRLCETATTCVRKGAETAEAVNACVTARKPDLLAEVRNSLNGARP